MSNQVYANHMEVSCKSGNGKSICAFPDVCYTPPQTAATPTGVPVPYPNTGLSSDCTDGSRTVKISGQEIMLKDKSYFKTSTGDEAGCAPLKGIATTKNKGKVYFKAWSMDVRVEGENVVRHLDITTHNHACEGPNTPPMSHIDEMTPEQAMECKKQSEDASTKCEGKIPDKCDDECRDAQKCQLVPFNKSKAQCCAPGNTGDHLVEASAFYDKGRGGSDSAALKGCSSYSANHAPCCCVTGGAYSKEHGRMSTLRGAAAQHRPAGTLTLSTGGTIEKPHVTTYGQAKKVAARALVLTFPQCKDECILAQFEGFDKEHGLANEMEIKATTYGDPDKWGGRHGIQAQVETMNKLSGATSPGLAAL